MKRFLLIFFLFFSFFNSRSQGIDNLWMMGYGGAIDTPFGGINMDFISGSPVITHVANRDMWMSSTSATICDVNGNTLFYTNGEYIADATNDTMMNGSGISPSTYSPVSGYGLFLTQAVLIIPIPSDTSKYYLLHMNVDGFPLQSYHIYFSVIDMSMNGNLGAVVSKNNVLLNDTLIPARLTSTRHGNGRDWWLVFHQTTSDLYYIYLIDPSGIHLHSMQHIGTVYSYGNASGYNVGQACFSPDGSRFAMYNPPNGGQLKDLDIFDFDRCSGQFSNPVHVSINDPGPEGAGGGVAFSPSSKVLYVSSCLYVYQFDLAAIDIPSSQTMVAAWDGYYSPSPPLATVFFLSQLAPDGKIYINCENGTLDIHVINNPDSLGLACDVCQHCVHLPAYNGFTMPNLPNYHLGALPGSICDSSEVGNQEIGVRIEKINVFPNPVILNGEITFTYPSVGDKTFLIINNTEGKEVARYELPLWSSVQHLKLPKLSSGVYVARLVGKSALGNVKFLVE